MGTDGDRDGLGGVRGIGLPIRVDLIALHIAVVEELVRKNQRVEVAESVERADRVGVVAPAFVSRDVALDGPGEATVPGLVEPEHVVVALRAREPLGLADQVIGIHRVDPDVRL